MLELQELVEHAPSFLLIFIRIISLLIVAPIFSSKGVPSMARAGIALFTAGFVFSRLFTEGQITPVIVNLNFVLMLLAEVALGLMIGLFLNLIMAIFQSAGEYFAMQMGLAAAQGVDPLTSIESPLVGQLFNLIALWVLITSNGLQQLFFRGIYQSFEVVQASQLIIDPNHYASFWLSMLGYLFLESFMIAAPIVVILFFLSLALGLLARAAPQMNLLVLGLPVQFALGIFLIFLLIPQIVKMMELIFEQGFMLLGKFYTLDQEVNI